MRAMAAADRRPTTERLGYPADARLLIINADDFGMCHAINAATIRAMREGVVSSTSLMAPCSWAPHAMQLLRDHPDLSFGVHLTIVSEQPTYRWGPLASKDTVPSLLDEAGYFYSDDRRAELLARAELDEVEREFRAQIAAVLAARLKPTHLDFHCIGDGGRPDIFDLTLALAQEYGLALRTDGRDSTEKARRAGLPANDHGVLDSYSVPVTGKADRYAQLLRELPVGLSEWAVHASLGDAEAQAMEPGSWQVRKSDFDFLISPVARDILAAEGIVLLDYRALQQVAWH
jgi:chitin disaccharide deacetylase